MFSWRGLPRVALVPRLPWATIVNPYGVLSWRALRARRWARARRGEVALAAESARRPFGELCWPAECVPHRPNEHLHSEPSSRHGAAVRERGARGVGRAAARRSGATAERSN